MPLNSCYLKIARLFVVPLNHRFVIKNELLAQDLTGQILYVYFTNIIHTVLQGMTRMQL